MDNGCLLVCLLPVIKTIEASVRWRQSTSLLDRTATRTNRRQPTPDGPGDVNAFDGDKRMDDLYYRRPSGATSVFDFIGGLPALCGGAALQGPRSRVWVVYSGKSLSLLVGDPSCETDLHYWDGLANQDEVSGCLLMRIIMRGAGPGRQRRRCDSSLDLVVRSLYPHAKVDWNGASILWGLRGLFPVFRRHCRPSRRDYRIDARRRRLTA